MPYQRHRSYRRAARLYRRPGLRARRSRFALRTAFLAATLAVVLAVTLSPHSPAALTAASNPVRPVNTGASCDIIVPARPLSATGLATPYRLTGPQGTRSAAWGCTMANAANLGAFVQATILDPATGALSVYEPLVITQGTKPAITPVVPRLPPDAVVTIDIGFNGTTLRQIGGTSRALGDGRCVNGLGNSLFGQVSFCNGTAFFRAAF